MVFYPYPERMRHKKIYPLSHAQTLPTLSVMKRDVFFLSLGLRELNDIRFQYAAIKYFTCHLQLTRKHCEQEP